MSAPSLEAEAARYALLRRLAPSMRHHLVVNLQPIGMIYEVMERRLRAPVPDLAQVQDCASKINGFARAAIGSCIDVVSWLAPDAAATTTVEEAVRESAALLSTSLSFRGYALRNEAAAVPGTISLPAVRALLTGALVYCSDQLPAPAELVLSARAEAGRACITMDLRPTPGQVVNFKGEASYRKLAWTDLQALATAEGVELLGEGAQRVEIRLPLLPPA
jgi:hypothetical protein